MGLQRGALSEVMRVADNNWAIFRAEDSVRPADTSDPVIMARIRNHIFTYERGRAEDWVIREAEQFAAEVRDRDFDSVVADRGMIKRTFGPLPINFGNAALFPSVLASGIPELSNQGSNELFWQAAFSTPLNTPSIPVVLGPNVMVFFPLEEVEANEEDIELIQRFFSFWLSNIAEQDFRSFFLNHEKLDDRFMDMFARLFL